MEHRDRIIQEFSSQADRFARSPHVNRADHEQRFLGMLDLRPTDRVLDVACGPGLLARAMAPRVAEVVGVDLTPAMLEKGRTLLREAGHDNVVLQEADAQALPFADGTFDVVVSRLALHHLADPGGAVVEMARVLRPGGRLGVFDQVTSEDPGEETYHNRVERLRDRSHARALPLSELCRLVGLAGLQVTAVDTIDHEQDLDDWLARANPTAEEADEVRCLVRAAVGTTLLGGRRVFEAPGGGLAFMIRWALLRAQR